MEEKRSTIYFSSKDALARVFVLILTIGISILASFIDHKSCYVTIFVQALNNIYDFYPYTDNIKNTSVVKKESIIVVFSSIVAIIASITALSDVYTAMNATWMKFICIFLIVIPLFVVYSDYKLNIKKENRLGA